MESFSDLDPLRDVGRCVPDIEGRAREHHRLPLPLLVDPGGDAAVGLLLLDLLEGVGVVLLHVVLEVLERPVGAAGAGLPSLDLHRAVVADDEVRGVHLLLAVLPQHAGPRLHG